MSLIGGPPGALGIPAGALGSPRGPWRPPGGPGGPVDRGLGQLEGGGPGAPGGPALLDPRTRGHFSHDPGGPPGLLRLSGDGRGDGPMASV